MKAPPAEHEAKPRRRRPVGRSCADGGLRAASSTHIGEACPPSTDGANREAREARAHAAATQCNVHAASKPSNPDGYTSHPSPRSSWDRR